MTKRGNNEGSIRQRPDGKWEARVTLHNGKRKSLYGNTRAEVAKKLTEAQRSLDQGLPVTTDRQTLEQFLAAWLKDVARPRVRASTHTRYQIDVDRITAAIGKRRLTEVTPQVVQRFLNDLTACGLSPATVRHTRAVLRSALDQAENWNLIARNPASRKRVSVPRGDRPEVSALTPTDARILLAAFAGDPIDSIVYLALATGARQGELLGMRWCDLDLDAGTFTIRVQLQRVDKSFVLTEPKSKQSRRLVALPTSAIDRLRAQRIRQLETRLAAGSGWIDNGWDLVFTRPDGQPLFGSWVTNHFGRRVKAAGLPAMRFHDLRHGAASLLIAQGADLRRVMEQLGHSQISMTANTYAHISAAVMRDNADKLHAALTGTD